MITLMEISRIFLLVISPFLNSFSDYLRNALFFFETKAFIGIGFIA